MQLRVLSVLRIAVLSFLFLINGVVSAHAAPSQITIGFIPSEDAEQLKTQLQDFAKLLQEKIRIPVQIYVSKDYAGLADAMKNKKIDFAFFSASTFVLAEKVAGAKVLLKKVWDSPFYHSSLVVRADSGITNIKQLKGKKIAFVDEKSGSGYLLPKVYFKQQKLGNDYFKESVFSGNQAASVTLLKDKKVDVAAVYSNDKKAKTGAWTKYGVDAKGPMKIRALWVSEPIPNDPFCVRQEFYDSNPRLAHDIMFGMIELIEDKASSENMKKFLGVSGLMLATTQQYEPLREMVRELEIQLK